MVLMVMDLAKQKRKVTSSKLTLTICFIIYFFSNSCNSFSKISSYNTLSTEEGYVKYENDSLQIKMLLYGDFKFVNNHAEYKMLSLKDKHPAPKKLLYGLTTDPAYYFIISLKSGKESPEFDTIKDITCYQGLQSRLSISKSAPESDIKFLFDNFKCNR